MKLIFKKAIAAMLSMTFICSTMTPTINTTKLVKPSIIADAANPCASFDEATGTLTLSGNVVKEEVQAWAGNQNVKKVTCAEGTVLPADCSYLFRRIDGRYTAYFYAEELDFSNADTSRVTNMQCMFWGCINLRNINLTDFDTSNVTNMSNMFAACKKLEYVDLTGFDTKNVTDMSSMFLACNSLKELDLSSFDTSNVQQMGSMFCDCENIEYLDLKTFNFENVTSMEYMFSNCFKLEHIDFNNEIDTSKVTNMRSMFHGCLELQSLDLSNFDTGNVTNMEDMLDGIRLTVLDVSSFDTSNVTNMAFMFCGCPNLESIYGLDHFDTSNVEDMHGMFYCSKLLESLDLSSFDTSNVTNMEYMFGQCKSIRALDLSTFDTSKVIYMHEMFAYCDSLTKIFVSDKWTTKSLILDDRYHDESEIFRDDTNLVGGNGTSYDPSCKGYEMACIDTPETPGYLTSVNDINNTPIILIPGIMGSRLFLDPNCEICFWPPLINDKVLDTVAANIIGDNIRINASAKIFQAGLNQEEAYLRDVYVNQNAIEEGEREYGVINCMKDIVNTLCTEYPNRPVYVFSYDFRKSNVVNAEKLNELIETICPSNTNQKVDIIAHSMGGLIASQYYKRYGYVKLNNVITMGTPYEGSPLLLKALASPYFFDSIFSGIIGYYAEWLGLSNDVKRSFAGVSELVPSERYFKSSPMYIYNRNSWWNGSDYKTPLSLDEYRNILKHFFDSENHPNAAKNAIDFQNSLINSSGYNWLYDYKNAYFVVGTGKSTIKSVMFEIDDEPVGWDGYCVTDLEYTNEGDGTVPLLSSSMLNNLDLNDKYKVCPVPDVHINLMDNEKAVKWVKAILNGNPIPAEPYVSTSSPYAVIRVACPVDVEISDGNDMLSSVDGAESFDASFGRLDLIGRNNEIKMICMDEDTNLDINLTGTGTGTMDYTIRHYSADEKLLDERTFENVPITDKSIIKTKADNNEVTVLSIDNDGDGVVDDTWTAKKNEIIKSSDSDKTETITSSTTITTVAATTTAANTTTTTKIATTATTTATATTTTTTTASTTTTTKIATTTTAANTTTTTKDTATTTSATTTTKATTSTTAATTTTTTKATATTTSATTENNRSLGDVDDNGILDAVDASKILANYAKYSTGTTTPTEDDLAVCDVNKDGYIDAVDASRVLAFYAHTSTGGKLSLEEFMKK